MVIMNHGVLTFVVKSNEQSKARVIFSHRCSAKIASLASKSGALRTLPCMINVHHVSVTNSTPIRRSV